MLPVLRLLLVLFSCGLAFLVIFQAPNLFLWRFAIVATEYGHWILILPLAIVIWNCCAAESRLTVYITTLGILSISLFFVPSYQAWCLARYLPLQLAEAYGPAALSGSPFEFTRLWFHPRRPIIRHTEFQFPTQDGSKLGLDFYYSPLPGRRPCVIVVHGGGWTSGNYHQLSALNPILASVGFQVAAINYRLAPKNTWPSQKEDLLAALAWLRQQSDRLNIDPQRFVILGRSAGGQIALATCYGTNDPGIRGCIALYAPTDIGFAYRYGRDDDILKSRGLIRQFMGGTPAEHPERYDDASPIKLVTDQSPPTLLIHGTRDELVWYLHSHRLQRAILEDRRPCFLLDLPWATHAFDLNVDGPSGQLSLFAIRWFLTVVTR